MAIRAELRGQYRRCGRPFSKRKEALAPPVRQPSRPAATAGKMTGGCLTGCRGRRAAEIWPNGSIFFADEECRAWIGDMLMPVLPSNLLAVDPVLLLLCLICGPMHTFSLQLATGPVGETKEISNHRGIAVIYSYVSLSYVSE